MAQSLRYDHISLRNIRTTLNVKPDPWHRENNPQPAEISVKIPYPRELIQQSADHDDVQYSLDYGKLFRAITARLTQLYSTESTGVHEIAQNVVDECFAQLSTTAKHQVGSDVWAKVVNEAVVDASIYLPKGVLRADGGLTYHVVRTASESELLEVWKIHDMRCYCILGINTHERLEKQRVHVSMEFSKRNLALTDIQRAATSLAQSIEDSSYLTVEALASNISEKAIRGLNLGSITLSIEKPSAISMVECSIVEITRRREDFD
ncbi:hypothetical protein KEM54_004841 [Ascosphaera aggregata]|nr:hypothetical protein KEM54_004841 [Ascosphaera aggregata]